ncbi:hypothetical protein BDV12DRAFT_207149 [Aspergillus spectabilis]
MEHPSSSLLAACANPDALFKTPTETLLHTVYKEFSHEINCLRRAYSVRPASNHDEVNRTLVSFLALRWVHLGDYVNFVGTQSSSETQLTTESFTYLQTIYKTLITTTEALYTLITLIITNDLGKDPHLATEYQIATGIDISNQNHDAILLSAYKANLIPSLSYMPSAGGYKSDAISGIELGATFNFGQLAQGENAPVSLAGLLPLKSTGNKRAFQFRFLEQIFDIAGAAGHIDWSCARKIGQNQAVWDSLRAVYEACSAVLEQGLGLREAYDKVLRGREGGLRERGFAVLRGEDEDVEMSGTDRAFMRVLCMGNVTSFESAVLYKDTWDRLDEGVRAGLVYSLNVFGRRGEPAVQPTYMPALLSGIKDERALACAFQFLCRVMTAPEDVGDPSAVVIERSVLGVLKQYVETGQFREDPTVLDRADVPKGVVAQTESGV